MYVYNNKEMKRVSPKLNDCMGSCYDVHTIYTLSTYMASCYLCAINTYIMRVGWIDSLCHYTDHDYSLSNNL